VVAEKPGPPPVATLAPAREMLNPVSPGTVAEMAIVTVKGALALGVEVLGDAVTEPPAPA
jgi:hypothetical protein